MSYKSFRMKTTGGSALENELKNAYIDQILPFVETFFLFHIGMLLRRLNVYTVVERFARGHVYTMATAMY